MLDDGTTQIHQYEYNSLGKVTKTVDPVGRTTVFVYAANDFDLLEIKHVGPSGLERLAAFTYNSQHLPQTLTDAAGQTSVNTYNARGQLLTTRNPKGETTTFNYDANGFLLSIDGPMVGTADRTSFTYDNTNRVRTVTDSEGYTLTFDYDNFNRPTRVSYPDATYEFVTYNRLDPVVFRDRMGRLTQRSYDALRHLTSVTDALNRVTRFGWCGCGSLESLTDALGRMTHWSYDVQGRQTGKQYADGSRIEYRYEAAFGRLKQVKDEKGQFKNYEYFTDNSLKRVSYPNAQIATPTVSFTYDSYYNRQATMTDGFGVTSYGYFPVTASPALGASRLASVDGPLPNDTITYAYDALGRTISRAINGVAETAAYDALGRVALVTNALGSFTNTYVRNTGRLAEVKYPNGIRTLFNYFDNLREQRLEAITNLAPNAQVISRFNYLYTPAGQITNWTQGFGTSPVQVHSFGYDTADQLISVIIKTGALTTKTYTYAYDPAGNRTLDASNALSVTASYNSLNELVSRSPATNAARTYEWDVENRLVGIQEGGNRTEFGYDGLGRRIRIVQRTGALTNSDLRYLWCGTGLREERASAGTVFRRLLPQGLLEGLQRSFYTFDHLGSIREVLDLSGSRRARHYYSPYGIVESREGSFDAPFLFTGHFNHRESGLLLTLFRAFDPLLGRWISGDPIGEAEGVNLHQYARNNPTRYVDRLGLEVLIGQHYALLVGGYAWQPGMHQTLVFRPANPQDFVNNPNFAPSGGASATLSGQMSWASGSLYSAWNYAGDTPGGLSDLTVIPTPPGLTDSQFINNIIAAAGAYRDNLPYGPFPDSRFVTFNCNSYAAGVVEAAGGALPDLPGWQPGSWRPIPIPISVIPNKPNPLAGVQQILNELDARFPTHQPELGHF